MDYSTSTSILGTISMVSSLITIAIGIFYLIVYWKIFVKADEPGWKCLIPFYNLYIMCKIAFGSGWWFLLMCIPFVNFVFLILLLVFLGKAFNKGAGFCVGLVLLSFIFLPILAFDNSEYYGPAR